MIKLLRRLTWENRYLHLLRHDTGQTTSQRIQNNIGHWTTIRTTLTIKVGLKIIDLKVLSKAYNVSDTQSTRVQHEISRTTLELKQHHNNSISILLKILYYKPNKLQLSQIEYTRSKTRDFHRETNNFLCQIRKQNWEQLSLLVKLVNEYKNYHFLQKIVLIIKRVLT